MGLYNYLNQQSQNKLNLYQISKNKDDKKSEFNNAGNQTKLILKKRKLPSKSKTTRNRI